MDLLPPTGGFFMHKKEKCHNLLYHINKNVQET